MMRPLLIFWVCIFLSDKISSQVSGSNDSTTLSATTPSAAMPKTALQLNPKTATIRSAIIPGWGQIYNKRYWKLPLVWGALGTTAGVFVYNLKNYTLLKKAYINLKDGDDSNNSEIDPRFRNMAPESVRAYRNSFRQDVDYAVLFFLLFWGLNVVDATVDAHLKAFDVDDNLSIKIKAGYSDLAKTSGVSVVLSFKYPSKAK